MRQFFTAFLLLFVASCASLNFNINSAPEITKIEIRKIKVEGCDHILSYEGKILLCDGNSGKIVIVNEYSAREISAEPFSYISVYSGKLVYRSLFDGVVYQIDIESGIKRVMDIESGLSNTVIQADDYCIIEVYPEIGYFLRKYSNNVQKTLFEPPQGIVKEVKYKNGIIGIMTDKSIMLIDAMGNTVFNDTTFTADDFDITDGGIIYIEKGNLFFSSGVKSILLGSSKNYEKVSVGEENIYLYDPFSGEIEVLKVK